MKIYAKKALLAVLVMCALIFGMIQSTRPAYAQTPTPTPKPNQIEDKITFTLLGQTQIALTGPVSQSDMDISLPAGWEIQEGSELHLNLSALLAGSQPSVNQVGATSPVTGHLEVILNKTSLITIQIDQSGELSSIIKLPATAWLNTTNGKSQSLTFRLVTTDPCSDNFNSIITIQPSSYFVLQYVNKPPTTELWNLPYPFLQKSIVPDTAILVTPDQASAGEMQAALTVAAAFGRMTQGQIKMTYITARLLTNKLRENDNIIFVGKPGAFADLKTITLPAPLNDGQFSNTNIAPEDGVLQLVVSPWNDRKVILLVSGPSDAGVIKASQAIGNKKIRTDNQPNLAIVSSVNIKADNAPTVTDLTLSNLGYETNTQWGPGVRYGAYFFDIPLDQKVMEGAYFNLIFSNAAMLDFEQAGVSVILNGDYIGSLRFNDRTTQVSNWRLNLPSSSFRSGRNLLLVQALLVPIKHCVADRETELWLSTRADSTLHLPLGIADTKVQEHNLSAYPAPFLPTFDRTAFVLSSTDSFSWSVAEQIAYDLGSNTGGSIINLVAAYADNVPEPIRRERNLLVLGRPSKLQIIQQFGQSMPGPITANSDIPEEPAAQLKFRISKDTPLGFLEIFESPWNSERSIVAVLGSNDIGLSSAGMALLTPALRSQLTGNFAIVYKDQITTSQITPKKVIKPTPTITPSAQAQPESKGSNYYALAALILIGVVIVLVVVMIIIRQRRKAKKKL